MNMGCVENRPALSLSEGTGAKEKEGWGQGTYNYNLLSRGREENGAGRERVLGKCDGTRAGCPKKQRQSGARIGGGGGRSAEEQKKKKAIKAPLTLCWLVVLGGRG